MPYSPPLTLTTRLIDLISRVSEALGRWEVADGVMSPKLRRENRIRTIHSSLAIEANTLSIDQVTAPATDQVGDQVSDQVNRLIKAFGAGEILAAAVLMERLGLKHLPTFRRNYLKPALAAGLIRMTQPDSPNSPTQRYHLVSQGA